MNNARLVSAKNQPLISDSDNFLTPLNSPEVREIISTAGDTGRKYTIERLLRLYLFVSVLKGYFLSLCGIATLSGNLSCCLFVGIGRWTKQGLSDANKRVSFTVFKKIYEYLSKQIDSQFSMPRIAERFGKFKIFDCTHLVLALKLMPWGKKQNQRRKKGQLKVSTRIDEGSQVPDVINLDPDIKTMTFISRI